MKKKPFSQILCTAALLGILLGVHDGKIALWKDDDPIPYRIFPYSINMLPKDAQDALYKGIRVESMDDLHGLIEKYLP